MKKKSGQTGKKFSTLSCDLDDPADFQKQYT